MGLTSLTPLYEILPHGVCEKNGRIYARFKVTVSIAEMNVHSAEGIFETADITGGWEQLVKNVNGATWKYSITKDGAGRNLITFSIDGAFAGNKLQFRIFSVKSDRDTFSDSFHFGDRWVNGKYLDSCKFAEKCYIDVMAPASQGKSGALATNGDRRPMMQFESIKNFGKKTVSLVAEDGDRSYGSILDAANSFAPEVRTSQTNTAEHKYNLFPIYAAILEEPEAAEKMFGLMREFLIDVTELNVLGDQFEYTIIVGKEEANRLSFRKDIRGGTAKYYNGPAKVFFTDKGVGAEQDFKSIFISKHDNYKAELEKNALHPDGIYLSVLYNENTDGSIIDPFERPEYHSSGFNILMKTLQADICSLSLRSKQLYFPTWDLNTQNLVRSGRLTARATLLTKKAEYRANLLMAWRGDSLVLNRVPKKLKDSKSDEQIEEKGEVGTDTDYCEEDIFVRTKLLQKKEHLVEDSQVQLISGYKYFFWCRTVSHTGFYLPSRSELLLTDTGKKELAYTITVEDLVPNESAPLAEIDFNVSGLEMLPIGSPMLYGTIDYKKNTSTVVDTAQHIVLNVEQGERNEIRWIFPPQLKLEDFKFLNFLTRERLTVETSGQIDVGTFVSRCVRLEGKADRKMAWSYGGRVPVNYLADIRANSLLFYPADIFTASKRNHIKKKAFPYTDKYPFYEKVLSAMVTTARHGKTSVLKLLGPGGEEILYDGLEDGIYNFYVYAVNEDYVFSPTTLALYNKIDLRVSIVNKPPVPQQDPITEVSRNMQDGQKNFWFAPLSIKKLSDCWKSVKYLEEDTVLQLRHEKADQLLRDYYSAGNPRLPLMEDEYPYDVFLKKEGSLKEGLQTNIYSNKIGIRYSIPTELKNKGIFFSLQLNEGDILQARWDMTTGASLVLGDKSLPGNAFEIDIVFDQANNKYVVNVGGTTWPLSKYPHPELSIRDFNIPDEALRFIVADPKIFQFRKGGDYIFITDQSDPYSRLKTIKLFGSTIFQAYYPGEKSELKIGSPGIDMILAVPNNEIPVPPLMDLDILLMHTRDSRWLDNGSYNVKENKTESLVRITLQKDFMKEGKNRLGIVIAKYEQKENPETDKYISRIGEDITKLTSADWQNNNLKDVLGFDASLDIFKKYLASESTKFYWIGNEDTTYEVMEFEPYYNVDLKKWQVVLPFKILRTSEVMFIKFVCLKIAPGHGLKEVSLFFPGRNTTYRDTTGTCISAFSEPAQLPIYSKKVISLHLRRVGGRHEYAININSFSSYERKQYFAFIPKSQPLDDTSFSFLRQETETDSLKNFHPFEWVEKPEEGAKRMLRFSNIRSLTIAPKGGEYLVILEFEMHKNNDIEGNSNSKFKDVGFEEYNPLFDRKGLRLINVSEFKL